MPFFGYSGLMVFIQLIPAISVDLGAYGFSCTSSNIFVIIPRYKLQFPSYLLLYLVYVLFSVVWNCSVSLLSCAAAQQSLHSSRDSAETLVADSVSDYFFLSWSDSKLGRVVIHFFRFTTPVILPYHLQIFAVGPANVCFATLHPSSPREGGHLFLWLQMLCHPSPRRSYCLYLS